MQMKSNMKGKNKNFEMSILRMKRKHQGEREAMVSPLSVVGFEEDQLFF